jgi:predicted AlkP superfamily pyrophosphatase or phosphodiesterase
MIPVFPSLTFPNHYSLVTGLYPEHHGIVANSFYDPARRQTYALGNPGTVTDGTWYRGEPIWVTAETQGMVAACFFWPGSEAPIRGVRPTMSKVYDAKIPNAERVKTVLEWLRLPPEKRPHLVTLYFSDVDSASHAGTLDAPRVNDALRMVDTAVGMLIDGIDALPIRSQVYVVVTSDHGMVETTATQGVRLDSLVDMDEIEQSFGGPVAMLHVRGGERSRASRVRDAVNARLQHGRAYMRHEVPERHHFRHDPRIGDVVIVMDEGWTIVVMPRLVDAASRIVRPDRWGAHGWDPAFPSMHAIFIASGPGIRAGATIPVVNNVDVYPLMTELLGLRPSIGIDGKQGLRELLMPK